MKKLLTSALALVMVAGLVTGCSTKNGGTTATPTPGAEGGNEGGSACVMTIGLVTDLGGIDDKSFNQGTWEGVVKFAQDNNMKENECYSYLQSTADADYIPNLSTFADKKVDLIEAPGFLFEDAMKEVADLFPDQKFVIIDTEVDKPNVASAVFKEQQPSYLVGVAAAMKAQEAGKTKVGFIGGVENPIIERFEAGYKQGVASVDPSIEVLTDYANAFDDPGKGSTLAQKQYNDGAYVIFHAAGATGNGLIKEAKDRREANEDVWAIGVDSDQYDAGLMSDGSSAVLTSALKRVDTAAYYFAEQVKNGTFQGGTMVFDASNDGIGFPKENPNLSDEIVAAMNDALTKIKSGEIVVNETVE